MPADPPTPPYDPATAYHEAGHAAVALHLGRPVHRVTVLPTRDRLGLCEFRKGVQRPTDDWIEAEILIALAGMAAEARHAGRYDRGGAGRDLRHARQLMLSRSSERGLDRYERRMLAKAESLLADAAIWQAVEWIAAELLARGTVSGRAARHFYDRAAAG